MDLQVLSQGRSMLIARGAVGFLFGVIASNQPGISPSALVTLFGVWAFLEGAAMVRQAYQPSGLPGRVQAVPLLMVLGGVALVVGVVSIFGLGLATSAGMWLLAVWLGSRTIFELLAAVSAVARRAKVLFSLTAVLDVVLIGFLITHTTGSVLNVALMGGGVAALWGVGYLVIGVGTAKMHGFLAAGPSLLQGR